MSYGKKIWSGLIDVDQKKENGKLPLKIKNIYVL
jgi:hypothetical protein